MCIGLGHLDDTAGANPRASWPPHDDNMTFGKQKRAISDFSPRQLLSSDSSLYFIFGLFVFTLRLHSPGPQVVAKEMPFFGLITNLGDPMHWRM